MYLEFYNLTKPPFGSDPEVVFPGAQYRYSLATLKHGVTQGMGMLLLTGEQGCGKSTLFRTLKTELEGEGQTLLIIDDHRTAISDVVSSIASLLDRARAGMGLNDLVDRIRGRLVELSEEGRKLVVLVEGAERLSDDVLLGLGVLSGIGTPQYKLLQVVLVGEQGLKARIEGGSLKDLQSRIRLHLELEKLSEAETAAYIDYRISAAGGEPSLFTSESKGILFQASLGNPGEIDRLCERALFIGFERGLHFIDADVARDAALSVPLKSGPAQGDLNIHRSLQTESPITSVSVEGTRLSVPPDEEPVDLSQQTEYSGNEVSHTSHRRRRGVERRFGVVVAVVVGGIFLGALGYLISDLRGNGFAGGVSVPKGVERNSLDPGRNAGAAAEAGVQIDVGAGSAPVIYQLLSGGDELSGSDEIPAVSSNDQEGQAIELNPAVPVLAATEGVKPQVRPLELEKVVEEPDPVSSEDSSLEVVSEVKPGAASKGEMPFPFGRQSEGEWRKMPDKLTLSQVARKQFGSWNDSVKDILRQSNPRIKNFDAIAAGTRIWIPVISPEKLVVHHKGVGYYFYYRSTTGPITARKNKSYLQKKGFDAIVQSVSVPNGILHRVYAGPFDTSEQAEKAMGSVKFTFAPNVLD